MISFRVKIVSSLIGLSLLSFALGTYYTRSVLSDRFSDVVTLRYAESFLRDALGYYRPHGSWELAHQNEPFNDYTDRVGIQPPPPPILSAPDLEDGPPPPRFAIADLEGSVWIGGDNFSVGDVVIQAKLQQAIPILESGESIGYLLPVGEVATTHVEDDFLELLSHAWWISLILVLLIAVPLGLILGNHFAGPINNLIRAIGAMGPSSLRQKVPVNSKDELGLLSRNFNQMSEDLADFVQLTKSQRKKISETESMLRQALVNVSHELRTPLHKTVSQAYAMIDGVRSLDREQMIKLASSLDYLASLVDDLHQLSLADVKAMQFDLELVDFSRLIKECVAAAEEDFSLKGFNLDLSLPVELEINGDKTRLRQIVENLLSNCIRYANQGAGIKVALSSHKEYVELLVSDSGPGVPDESLGLLFDRFYRVDSSRSRTSGGTGLGLSIVKTCAEIHGGEAEAFASEQGGLAIRVRIPATTQPMQN